jgi:hypothetical protein
MITKDNLSPSSKYQKGRQDRKFSSERLIGRLPFLKILPRFQSSDRARMKQMSMGLSNNVVVGFIPA